MVYKCFKNIKIDYDELITGEKFSLLGDYIYFHYSFKKTGNIANATNFYTDTQISDDELKDFFKSIPQHNNNLRIISHNGDRNIGINWADYIPTNVKYWFTQNVNCEHSKIVSIPIGLENDRWFPEQKKKEKILAARYSGKLPSKLLYMNHAIWTNPNARQKPYDLFENKNWVTSIRGENGSGFDEYLSNIIDHCCVICCAGKGEDTHRMWETLYCNRIPIVIKSYNTKFYSDLPIIQINNWEEINERFLLQQIEEMNHKNFNFDKLLFSYWRNLILQI